MLSMNICAHNAVILIAGLGDSSEESDDDDDVGGRRGRTAHHTFAPLGSQASGPSVANTRGRASRKLAPASAAMEESSSERYLHM